jgi:serine/alanine adding enzyme
MGTEHGFVLQNTDELTLSIEIRQDEGNSSAALCAAPRVEVRALRGANALREAQTIGALAVRSENPATDLRWLSVLSEGLGHEPLLLVATENDRPAGHLPLALVSSRIFGRHLISLPYVSTGGVAADEPVASRLVDAAIALAEELRVKQLQLRHETPLAHPALSPGMEHKMHMRLALPATYDGLWKALDAKVRNQVRKAEKADFSVAWGGAELLRPFYDVFSRNMRDLGTPVYPRSLFAAILRHFENDAELCVVRDGAAPIAAGIVVHGSGLTQVPSASSLREHNARCPNMLLYAYLLRRAIERGQLTFDFGRSSAESGTFRFKSQWGALPIPTAWQFYVRSGSPGDVRPESGKFRLATRIWQRLPLCVTRRLGPIIAKGIPV